MLPVQTARTVNGAPGPPSTGSDGLSGPRPPRFPSATVPLPTGTAGRSASRCGARVPRSVGVGAQRTVTRPPGAGPYPGAMSRGRVWAWAGLAVLVVVNVVLIGMLLLPSDGSQAQDVVPSAVSTSAEVEQPQAEAPVEEPTPTEEAPPPLQPEPTQRLLWAVSEREAWRAAVGACDVPGSLERTTDAGVTWAAQPVQVSPIARLKASSAADVFAIGGGADCAPTFRFSENSGQTWVTANNELPGSWYLLPASRAALAAEVHGPRGTAPAPCPSGVVDLAGLDTNRAALLCTDGAFYSTDDGGASWSQEGATAQALAIAPTADGYLIGAVREACEGLAVLSVGNDGTGLDAEAPVCAPVSAPVPGQVALAAAGPNLWVWSGDALVRSGDGGLTW